MGELRREKIWDPVIRLWHWVLVAAVCTTWYFGEFMTFASIDWHFYGGYTVLGLVAFRLLWGFVGPRPVRLGALLPRPRTIVAYLKHVGRREPSGTPGHNPLGALSVVAIVFALIAQGSSGLFLRSDEFFESGPLARYVEESTSNMLSSWHELMAYLILALVVLHLGAIAFYRIWKHENLVLPMITGWKLVRDKSDSP